MIGRLTRWLWALAISLDQLAHVLMAGPKYLLLGGPAPDPDETISSKVGRMAVAGKRWARIVEPVIDWIFERLGDGPGHCRRNIGR